VPYDWVLCWKLSNDCRLDAVVPLGAMCLLLTWQQKHKGDRYRFALGNVSRYRLHCTVTAVDDWRMIDGNCMRAH
jgi:hypothetical protein